MNINCIDYKIATANGVLQPIILQAIKDIYLNGNYQMTARMVRNQCILIDNNIPWNVRLPAICNSMRNSIECGGRIVGENRDSNDFTIAFDGNGNNLEMKTPKKPQPKVDLKPKDKSNYLSKPPHGKAIEIENLNLSKNFKIVMVCARGKRDSFFKAYPNENFVNTPVAGVLNEHHPDDIMNNSKMSWRDYLIINQNDNNLLEAYKLYTRNEYRYLYRKFKNNFYILSAGWGLVNSEYKLPKYDITFSSTANLRSKRNDNLIGVPVYKDFNDFKDVNKIPLINPKEDILYIGGKDYLELFYDLTQDLPNRKIIFKFNNTDIPTPPNNSFLIISYFISYPSFWYYQLAKDLCNL